MVQILEQNWLKSSWLHEGNVSLRVEHAVDQASCMIDGDFERGRLKLDGFLAVEDSSAADRMCRVVRNGLSIEALRTASGRRERPLERTNRSRCCGAL